MSDNFNWIGKIMMHSVTIKKEFSNQVLSSDLRKHTAIIDLQNEIKPPSVIGYLINSTIFTGLLFAPFHFAQAADAGSLLLERQQQAIQQKQLQTKILEKPEEEAKQPANIKEDIFLKEKGKAIVIKNILFTGKKDFLSESFQTELINGVKGKHLGIQGITQLANHITRILQQQGHLLAQALLPPQDITEGTVTINIIDGHLAKVQLNFIDQLPSIAASNVNKDVTLNNNAPVRAKKDLLQAIVNAHVDSDNVTKSALEEAILRVNDHPGIIAKSRLTQGDEPNSSDLIIDVRQQPIFTGSASIDNFGSSSTGQEQVRAEALFTDATGYGDTIQFLLVASQGQKFVNGGVSLPISTSNFTVNANYSFLNYHHIDDIGKELQLKGHANFVTLGLDYSFIRSRNFNVNFNVNVNGKTLVDGSNFGRLQDKKSFSSTLGVAADIRDTWMGGGASFLSANWTYGNLDLSGVESALEIDQQTLQTDGSFQHINVSLARIQKLTDTFSLFGRIYGQWANENLDSSEGFILGGATGVRGWTVGEASGDMGALGTIELRYDIPALVANGRMQLATFIDSGRIKVNQNPLRTSNTAACDCNSYSLSSIGISARWEYEYATLLVNYAQGVGNNPGRSADTNLNVDNTNDNYQFWLSATAKF